MTDSSVPGQRPDPVLPVRQAAPEAATAAGQLMERVLLLDRPCYVDQPPPYLDPDHGGLVLCGQNAGRQARQLRLMGYQGLLVIDPAAYESAAATSDEPFAPPPEGQLFGSSMNDVLQEQLDCGANIAMTPTRYVHAGEADALKAVMREAQAIERNDVVVAIPVAVAWLRDEFLLQLAAALQRIRQPKALILGGQYDPMDTANAPKNLRFLVEKVPKLGLWRTDLAAFDCPAYGGLFAAIGAGGSLRHLTPQDEKPQASSFPHWPAVLVPDLMTFVRANTLARRYANTVLPRCSCQICDGSFIDRFNHLGSEARAEAHAHNSATWSSWLPDFFGHRSLGDRQQWWKNRCGAAIDAHEAENARIQQPKAFKPTPALKAWATLPVSQPPSSGTMDSSFTEAEENDEPR
jgi:hypothetical protein